MAKAKKSNPGGVAENTADKSTAKRLVRVSRERHEPGAFESTLEGKYMLALAEHPMSFKAKGPLSHWQNVVGRSFSCLRRPSTSIEIEFTERPASNIFVSIDAEWLNTRLDQAGIVVSQLGDFVEHVDPVLMQIVEGLLKAEARCGAGAAESQMFRDAMVQHLAGWYSAGVKGRPVLRGGRLRAVIEYIDAHLSDALSLDALAAVAGLSRFEFARSFMAQTGIPPHRYVMLRRTEAAVAMIGDDAVPLSDIAPATGFCDQAHMSRWIAREIRVSPRRLRRIDLAEAALGSSSRKNAWSTGLLGFDAANAIVTGTYT